MGDILFKKDGYRFSYRVAGVLCRAGKILLQKPVGDPGYAVPGGHVAFGETNEETLIREFQEEIGAEIHVGALKWAAEIFFTWEGEPCHQICLYYDVAIAGAESIPLDGSFSGQELGETRAPMGFYWIPISDLENIQLYPPNLAALMKADGKGLCHFVWKETQLI